MTLQASAFPDPVLLDLDPVPAISATPEASTELMVDKAAHAVAIRTERVVKSINLEVTSGSYKSLLKAAEGLLKIGKKAYVMCCIGDEKTGPLLEIENVNGSLMGMIYHLKPFRVSYPFNLTAGSSAMSVYDRFTTLDDRLANQAISTFFRGYGADVA